MTGSIVDGPVVVMALLRQLRGTEARSTASTVPGNERPMYHLSLLGNHGDHETSSNPRVPIPNGCGAPTSAAEIVFFIALARGYCLHRSAMKLHEALQQLCVQANRTWTRPLLHPNASAPRCWLFKSYVELMLPALIVMTDIRRTQAEPTFETSGPPSIGTVVFEPT